MPDIDRDAIEEDERNRLAPFQVEALQALNGIPNLKTLEEVRIQLLGKSGRLAQLLKEVGSLPAAERPVRAAIRNRLKETITSALDAARQRLEASALDDRLKNETIDISAPPRPETAGLIHPISRSMEEIAAIFEHSGASPGQGDDGHVLPAIGLTAAAGSAHPHLAGANPHDA
jgi:phenylalanyl-tRNA synthetase alpha chain